MVSRYADVWHILNVVVREAHRDQGIGGRLLEELFERAGGKPHLGFTLEVRVSNAGAIHLYRRKGFVDHGIRPGYYSDNGEDAMIMWRSGGPEDDVLMSGPILAIETSCDETAAAVVDGRRILSNVVASQAELHSPYGGVVPEVAARHHLGTVNGVIDAALDGAGMELGDVDAIAVTQRPGPDRRAADRRRHGEGDRVRGGKAPGDGRPPARAHRRVAGSSRSRSTRRS